MKSNINSSNFNNFKDDKRDNTSERSEYKDKKISNLRYILPPKQFLNRRSLLIEQFEDNIHFRAGYNIVISLSLFVIFSLNFKEYIQHGRLSPAVYLIYEKFTKLHIAFIIWLGNNISTFLCYYLFNIWAHLRRKVHEKKIVDIVGISLLVTYFGLVFYFIPYLIYLYDLPFGSAMILLCEGVRFLLKVYAFVRENIPKVAISKKEEKSINLPTFYQYLQFIYFPTAVYRDVYPRSKHIRWSYVFSRIAELLWAMVCIAHLYVYTAVPIFKDVCIKPTTISEFFVMYLQVCVPSVLMLWLLFFTSVHLTQDCVGEMLKFGDRMFYSDWWNSLDMQQFFKKWNWVVGDWLYTYINKDVGEVFLPGRRNLAKFITILISALAHEWIFTTAAGFFCPIITAMMFLGAFLSSYVKIKKDSNYIHLINLILYPLGPGMIAAVMFLEHAARQNLPSKRDEMLVFWNNCVA